MKKAALLPLFLVSFFCFSSFTKITTYSYDKDELTPEFHKGRREALRALMPANSVAIFFSNPVCIRSNDVEFDFHQDPDLYYLTGCMEPNSALVIFKEEQNFDSVKTNEILFVPDRDPKQEMWTGRILGVDEARTTLGIVSVYSDQSKFFRNMNWKKFKTVMVRSLEHQDNGDDPDKDMLNKMIVDLRPGMGAGATSIANFKLADSLLIMLRKVKTPEEITLLRKAITITNAGHIELMKALLPDMTEYQVQAIVEYEFKMRGAEYEGYPSICGSGENSCTLHYTTNRRTFASGDLVLCDAGAEYHGYSADVTRTLPASGKFTADQKRIYNIVLAAQLAGIKKCRAGNDFHDPYNVTAEIVADSLLSLGIIKNKADYRLYYPHGSSHHIGLDVHDGDYEGTLVANNIITVEPGIYIPAGSDCDKRWWNIGIRIEDDVLITSGDPDVISGEIPKTVDGIEALMAQTSYLNN
ncbi:MAG TPA: aminopeptidase P family protein [Bacteroidia bacterium]|jgi:Xaa-Pro aminopeptidase|nr:aminopeptidase P family protein [Bacteroidia bacterium]